MSLTKQEIIAKATPYFLENGYKGTGLNPLLKTLGMSKGGFYHHFNSKDELAVSIAQTLYETQFQQVINIACGSGSVKEKMVRMVDIYQPALSNINYKNSINICLYMFEMMKTSVDIKQTISQNYDALMNALSGAFEKGIEEKELDGQLDVESAAIHFVSLLDGLILFQSIYPTSIENHTQQLMLQFYKSIKA